MRKCCYAYHIGDVLYEVTPYPETIIERLALLRDIMADIHKRDDECGEMQV